MVIPGMDQFDKYLATTMISSQYSPAIRAALGIGKQTLNRYYSKTDQSDLYHIAMGMYFEFFDRFYDLTELKCTCSATSFRSMLQTNIFSESMVGERVD